MKTVAMESTGVYWILLFEVLEQRGFECLLISSRSLHRVSGRKSDITDAQWIQKLHSYGLLESSFRPQADLIALRSLLRHRRSLIDHRSPHVLHVQKALLQMNVQLSQVVSDVTGVTGQAIIRAILSGVRDPKILASLQEPGCKKSGEEIGKALTGTWREEHLFVLKQAVALYDFYTQQIRECEEEIERMYSETRPDWDGGELPPQPPGKRNSRSKNRHHETEKIRRHLKRISGVDLSLVDGMGGFPGANGDPGMRDGHVEVPHREAFWFLAGTGAQARDFRGQGAQEQNLEDQEPSGTSLSNGGPGCETSRVCLWGLVPAPACPVGTISGNSGDSLRDRARGLLDVEVQDGV